ncbi:MAG: DinB family protein [Roseiflexaceae bacterium]
MNSIMTGYFLPNLQEYQAMRAQLIDALTDGDLGYTPGGANPTLGVLCREIGEVERAYIDSFKTLTLDFSYRNSTPGLEKSVAQLAAWYAELDAELQATVEGLSEGDIAGRVVDRGGGHVLPPLTQLQIYQEALLLFYGKAVVYLKGMGKPLPSRCRIGLAERVTSILVILSSCRVAPALARRSPVQAAARAYTGGLPRRTLRS